jgi:hypothetical protein
MSKKASQNRYGSDDDEDYETYDPKKETKKEMSPLFVKNGLDKVDTGEIVVNLSSKSEAMQRRTTKSSNLWLRSWVGWLRLLVSLRSGTSCGPTITLEHRISSNSTIIKK